ncbi:MAG: DUF1566 domain-containing protein [Nitrosomonas sp.]|nr:PEP-CTERM sorting domain-containing protein [Nitrosomonas sp.]OQW82031.1 MAG: hypothetical protein BVN30_09700 [Proteobacteria bacterium ST_bin16]TXI35942.1 MAG: DUF1566 domain-containing protein [Nitrosomonas sp.]
MVKLTKILLCSGVFSVGLLATANAALETRLGGLAVYDTDLNITWLADANYAKTSGYDADGLMNWHDANTWAASLSIEGVTGWRLPAVDTTCTGFNCSNSEMGHLFYNELGGKAKSPISLSSDPDLALFTHVQYGYWSGTGFASDPHLAWLFLFDYYERSGEQSVDFRSYVSYAWAVHDGDVGAGLVPEPETYAMMSIGLLMLFGFRRLKQC